ncbi:MAG: hydrogenase iron-sulfur subunit [archaeon GB-1867-035]|nr:hydrogenase iron-sulfur subunit [Candidatus Culexmicrobium profundum]
MEASEMENTIGDILVIGGGVAGITASLELAEKGFKVYLVEKEPSIGGHMAQLDKTFPTLDCSICILGPKMVEVSRHPNIELLTYSEVIDVKPIKNGSIFKVKILKKPRYVDEEKCIGCRRCEEKCPVKVPSEFESGMGLRKAIYIPFPQAVPNVATIDKDHCLYLNKGVCRICEKVCPAGAINYTQKPQELVVEVPSIIVATGFSLLDPSILPQYGYGRFQDVITSLQYERLMNAAGPTGGEIVRPSDKTHPSRIAIIQCVGSRNKKIKDYCSQICCMYAAKQAIVTKEHDPNIDVMVFYNDLNAPGKGHEDLLRRATEEYGIKYVKGLPSEVLWDEKSKKLIIRYSDLLNGEIRSVDVDLVVLCPAVVPSDDTSKLAEILGIELNEFGFFKTIGNVSVNTNVPGIYVCGVCQNPKDISHSVMQALAAAAQAASRVRHVNRRENVSSRVKPVEEEKVLSQEPRIGVFVCHCGLNIAAVIDVKAVVEEAKKLSNVVYAEDLMFACSKDGTERIKEAIKKYNLNRVVVASCTPRTHEPLFRSICEEAGLNPYLFEMVNIREHVSWVHKSYPEEATEKAKELVKMAVAKARLLEPLKRMEIEVTPAALVIGATISGLIAAKAIADSGFKTYLVESGERMGYDLYLYGYNEGVKWISDLVSSIKKHENIEFLPSTKIEDVKGSIGNFSVKLNQNGVNKEIKVGTIVVAVGAKEFKPTGLYGYGKFNNIYTLTEFQQMNGNVKNGETVVFLLCAGIGKNFDRTYCSAVCCERTIREAIKIKGKYPNLNVYILYRDIRLPVGGGKLYRQAREAGIVFIRYDLNKTPEVHQEDGKLIVDVYDITSQLDLEIFADKVVLVTSIIPLEENREISSKLKVPLDSHGFFLEAHPKLRPVDFSTDGIFLCGLAYGPQRLDESITQALAAASRALNTLMRGKVIAEAIIADVNPELCTGCGRCVNVCEFDAIKLEVTPDKQLVAKVDPLLCKGCGSCSVECPAKAITMYHFRDDQILNMLRAAFKKSVSRDKLKIVAFFCNWCGYAAADMAGISRYEYPPTVEIIRVMCSARVDPIYILYALLLGADGVLIVGCHPSDCHYISGNLRAEERILRVKEWLKDVGLEPERVRLEWASAGEGLRLAKIIKEFTLQIEKLGLNPLRGG